MEAESWQQVDRFFQAAVELEDHCRADFLDRACAGDTVLRSEVESLLIADSHDWNFLETPALELAAIFLADEQPRLTAGQRVRHYEIQRLIGKGGMGEVYLARDHILNRNIALKLLPFDYTKDEDRLQRFKREAETVSLLNHPNIITIHELGSDDDQQFIATELVEGETLRERIKRRQLSVADALEIAIQIASALAAAHRAKIIHRDIKPENIMLRPDGYVKVLDFGLAKLAEQSERHSIPTTDTRIDTSSGLLLGTLKYMSPEQVSGIPVDASSDIFSLGVVLYEMVSGRTPFNERDPTKLAESILKDETPPLSNDSEVIPARLNDLVSRMLSKDRKCRHQVAEELIIDLKAIKEELVLEAKSQARSSENRVRQVRTEFETEAEWYGGSRVGSIIRGTLRPSLPVGLLILLVLASVIGFASYKFLGSRDLTSGETVRQKGTWSTRAPISSPRWQAEPAVVNDVLYVVGGWKVCSAFADLEQYDPATDAWIRRAPMPTARGAHGVGVLDGKLYAVGGSIDCGVHTSSVEAYDPSNDSWDVRASLPNPRFGHVVAAANGKLYAIGGRSANGDYLSLNTEYDPHSDRWTERAPLPTPRSAMAVSVVKGIIYVIGGGGYAGTLATVEAYDPVTDSWTQKRPMTMSRVSFAASDSGGFIYVFGGRGSRIQVEEYDPAADSWEVVSRMPSPGTHFHAATLLDSIYLIGGSDGVNFSASVIAFTPNANASGTEEVHCPVLQVTPKAAMLTYRSNMTVGEIDGTIYAVGGFENTARFLAVNEAYDPVADTWTTKASLPAPRETRGTNSAVVDGKLYVIGGNAEGKCSNLNQAYDPATDSWATKAPMPTPRCHSAVVALDGLIYAIGGTNTTGAILYNTMEIYHPSTDKWTTGPPMPTARQDLGAVSLDGVLYAVGGGNPAMNPGGEQTMVETYDPVSKRWSAIPPMPTARSGMAVGVLNRMLVVVGGVTNEEASATVEVYDPKVGTWRILTTIPKPRAFISAVTVNDRLYIFGGNLSPDAFHSVSTNEAISLKACSNPR